MKLFAFLVVEFDNEDLILEDEVMTDESERQFCFFISNKINSFEEIWKGD